MEVKDPTVTVSSEPFGIYDARAIWYGPYNCAKCGDLIVKMAFEQGGLELDAPQEPIYPNHRWTTHHHNPNPTKIEPVAGLPPEIDRGRGGLSEPK